MKKGCEMEEESKMKEGLKNAAFGFGALISSIAGGPDQDPIQNMKDYCDSRSKTQVIERKIEEDQREYEKSINEISETKK